MHLTLCTVAIILGIASALPGNNYSSYTPPVVTYEAATTYAAPTSSPSYTPPPYGGDCGADCGGVCGDSKFFLT